MLVEQLRQLIKIIECGSINKASQELNISHQRLSACIRSLENEFGTDILIRRSNGCEPTADGKKILKIVSPFIDKLDHLKNSFIKNKYKDKHKGTLIIYRDSEIFLDYWLSFLPTFKKTYPNIQIKTREMSCSDICLLLKTTDFQIGITFFLESQLNELPDYLEFHSFSTRVPVVYGSKNHPYTSSGQMS